MIECFWLRLLLLLLLSFAPLPKHPTNQEVDETRGLDYGTVRRAVQRRIARSNGGGGGGKGKVVEKKKKKKISWRQIFKKHKIRKE